MNWLSRSTVLVVALAAVLVVPSASAQTFDSTDDASGNGFDLAVEGDPEFNVSGSVAKFSDGVRFNETDRLTSSDAGLILTDDMAVTFAGDIEVEGYQILADGPVGSGEEAYRVFVRGTEVVWQQQTSGQTGDDQVDCTWSGAEPFVSGWARRNHRNLLDDVVRVKAFDQDGNVLCDVTEELGQDGGADGDDVFDIEGGGSGSDTGLVSEVRLWDELVDPATLDRVADPTDNSFNLSAEGSEHALYFLEPIDPTGEADLENTVAIYGEPDAIPGEAYTFHAEGHNQSGFAIDPQTNLTAFISKTDGDSTSWLNNSTSAVQAFAVENEMVPAGAEVNATLFSLSIPGGFPEVGSWRLEVWMEKDVPGSPDANNKWVGTYDVKVEASATTATHETDLATFTGLTALEMAWFVGAAVAGVVLWSKSNDPAVRAFGSALPMLAGALLLAYGADQGLGSMWAGTVPLAATLFLVGVAMLVRLTYELVTDRDLVSREGFM